MSTGTVTSGLSASTNPMGPASGTLTSGSPTMESVTRGAGSGGEANSPSTLFASSTLHAGQATSTIAGPSSPATNDEPASSWSLGSHSSQSNMSPQLPTATHLSYSSTPNSYLDSGGLAGSGNKGLSSLQAGPSLSSGMSPGKSQQPSLTSLETYPTTTRMSSLTELATPTAGHLSVSDSNIAFVSSGSDQSSSLDSGFTSFNEGSSDTRVASCEAETSIMSSHQASYTTLPPSLSNSMSLMLSSSVTFGGQDSSFETTGASGSAFTTSYDRSGASMASDGATLPAEGLSTSQYTGDSLITRSLVSNTVTEDWDTGSISGATTSAGPSLPSSEIPGESTISGTGTQTAASLLSGGVVSPGNNYQESSSLTTSTRRIPSSTERRIMTSDGSVKVSVVVSYRSTITLSVSSDRLERSNPEGPTPGLSPAPNLPEPTGNGMSMSRETATSQNTASIESQVPADDSSSIPISPTSSSCRTTMMVYLVRETTTV